MVLSEFFNSRTILRVLIDPVTVIDWIRSNKFKFPNDVTLMSHWFDSTVSLLSVLLNSSMITADKHRWHNDNHLTRCRGMWCLSAREISPWRVERPESHFRTRTVLVALYSRSHPHLSFPRNMPGMTLVFGKARTWRCSNYQNRLRAINQFYGMSDKTLTQHEDDR